MQSCLHCMSCAVSEASLGILSIAAKCLAIAIICAWALPDCAMPMAAGMVGTIVPAMKTASKTMRMIAARGAGII